jgi:L-lactate dehydrogenase complex protein LldF
MAATKTAKFRKASSKAIKNPQLQHALDNVLGHFTEARSVAIQDFPDGVWDQLRDQASAIKTHAIENLDYYLDIVDRNVRRNGGHVHFAKDAKEANEIVMEIAEQSGARTVIKGKSMVSEEMGLNELMESRGMEPVETDLGEYIIQLSHETPFHIIAPAMHKTRQQVSDLFHQWLKTAPTDDIQELCTIARKALREKFASADMGITGANFVVAETGTVVLVTNEGNGRMTSSMPRVHVALAGMEKILPAIEDVALFLRLLPRSATGQKITSYNTFVSGPRGVGDEDGPEEFHLVLVDNGRLNLLRDERMREALKCIRCGACLNACPVYREVGGHAYGWVYSGPIGAIVTPMMTDMKEAKHLPYASTLCGACKDVCPVRINIPALLLHLRGREAEGDPATERSSTWVERFYMRRWRNMVSTRKAMERSSRLARLLQRPIKRKNKIRRLPIPLLSGWTKHRDFPALADKSFTEIWKNDLSKR